MELETKNLILRELCADDWQVLCQYACDSEINKHLSFGTLATESGAKQYIREAIEASKQAERQSFKLAMSFKEQPGFSGSCWLDITDTDNAVASIGYFLAKPFWGKGYATEMVQALLLIGFEQIRMHRIAANCDAENISSRKVLEKNGFQQEGLLRQNYLRKYGWSDTCLYAILSSEWLQTKL